MNKEQSALQISAFAVFWMAVNAGNTRYYAKRSEAREFDDKGDPAPVEGYGVYDTTVASEYAVAVYGDMDLAHEHVPAEAPAKPESVFETENVPAGEEAFEHAPAETEQVEPDETAGVSEDRPKRKRGRRS